MQRSDGSYDSANNPVTGNRYSVKDFGLYKAQIINVIYTDSEENNTSEDRNPQVLYEIRIMGGDRDGQVFRNAVELQNFGGISNYSERVWKGLTTVSRQDPASLLVLESYEELNGDVVYIQFVNGNIHYPVILGGARHASNTFEGATESDGPRYTSKFNGITTEINKDGEYTWTKANGLYSPAPTPNLNAPPLFLQDQFVELPGFEEAIQLTIGNEFNLSLKMNVTPGNGLEVALDGTADSFTVSTLIGSSFVINGTSDSFEMNTTAGLAVKVDGLSDTFSINGVAGASVSLEGTSDSFSVATAAGASLQVSGTSGVAIQDTLGDALSLSNGAVSLENASGAALSFDAAGFIKLGNSSGDALVILADLIESLTTASYAGFGAPGSNVADLAQLLVKIKLITG